MTAVEIKVIASSSKGNAYKISDGTTELLIECGIPINNIQVALEFHTSNLTACFISHAHQDHCKSAKDLIRLGIDIYTSQGTIDACELAGHRIHPIKSLNEIRVGSFQVLPFDVQHDAPEPLGFLFGSIITDEKLLFFTDTYFLKYTFKGLNYIMAECNYSLDVLQRSIYAGYIPIELVPRLMKSHMSLEHLIDMLKANDLRDVKQIYLMHLSSNNSDAERFKIEVQKATGTEVYIC